MISSASPAFTVLAATPTASIPDPHSRLSVTGLPATELGLQEPLRRLLPLQWEVGLALGHADPLALIEPESRYSLVRSPDFGRLHGLQEHRQVAALLLRRPCTLDEAIDHAGVARASAGALMNAASLCGWLKPSIQRRQESGRGFRRSLGRLRAALPGMR